MRPFKVQFLSPKNNRKSWQVEGLKKKESRICQRYSPSFWWAGDYAARGSTHGPCSFYGTLQKIIIYHCRGTRKKWKGSPSFFPPTAQTTELESKSDNVPSIWLHIGRKKSQAYKWHIYWPKLQPLPWHGLHFNLHARRTVLPARPRTTTCPQTKFELWLLWVKAFQIFHPLLTSQSSVPNWCQYIPLNQLYSQNWLKGI